MQADNRQWAPVDAEDEKQMKKEAAKRQKDGEKAAKKQEKSRIQRLEEEKDD